MRLEKPMVTLLRPEIRRSFYYCCIWGRCQYLDTSVDV